MQGIQFPARLEDKFVLPEAGEEDDAGREDTEGEGGGEGDYEVDPALPLLQGGNDFLQGVPGQGDLGAGRTQLLLPPHLQLEVLLPALRPARAPPDPVQGQLLPALGQTVLQVHTGHNLRCTV